MSAAKDIQKAADKLYGDITKQRDQIADLRQQHTAIKKTPRPLAEIVQDIENNVTSYAENIANDLNPGDFDKPKNFAPIDLFPHMLINHETDITRSLWSIACWANPDKMIEQLTERAKEAFGEDGLSTEEKAKQLTAIDQKILAAEKAEESIITELRTFGFNAVRRTDADPRAVLEVE